MVLSINPVIIILLVLLAETTVVSCFRNGNSHVLCFETEKQALLSFKNDLVSSSNELKSWDVAEEEDCCKWARVVCNNITGHVSELWLNEGHLKGKLNPSLLNLTHLTHLDLSFNDFWEINIPNFMGSLVGLRYLSLTCGGFKGMIPPHLRNLSSLHHLGLGDSYDDSYCILNNLYVENLQWLSGLSLLEHLDMSNVNLSKASDHWLLAMNTLPSLKELHLSCCGLRHVHFPSHVNLTSLEILDLRGNSFEDPIPSAIENMTSIVSLDLAGYALSDGKIPMTIGNLCNLEALDLEANDFGGEISNAFQSLSGCLSNRIQSLGLDYGYFTGQIPNEIGEFKNLVHLSLGGNNIYGPIPKSIGKLSALKSLDISFNQLNGSLPESVGSLSNLKELNLCSNQLTGSLPKSLASLSNLEVLEICSNHLEGDVSEVHFTNLTNLREIIAYGNQLSLRVSPHWIPPFHLDLIELGSWNLGPQFPMWLKSQKNFSSLDLSNTRISDAVPNWFWNLSTHGLIDLSHNQIYGEIPYLPATVDSKREIYLYSNNFTGLIPRISSGIWILDISNNFLSGDISHFFCDPMGNANKLGVFDLNDNLLSGEIPKHCWKHWPSLGSIHLDNNKLNGEIPSSMGHLQQLESLHLRNNNLIGKIPDSLQNQSYLYGLDLSLNDFAGTIPRWIGNLSVLEFLGLRSNKLIGHIPVELCELVSLQILDIADNMLSGTIPRCFGNLTTMMTLPAYGSILYSDYYGAKTIENAVLIIKGKESQIENTLFYLVTYLDLSCNNLSGEIPKELTNLQGLQSLNLSSNYLRGSIPDTIGNITWVESLDLSWNHLSGKIPSSISSLSFLNHLNLSYNNLSGKIPTGTQLQSFDAFSFMGNQLFGPPLPHDCGESERTTHGGAETEEEEEYWFRLGIAMGFVVSFLGIIGPLLFSRIWRRAYFWFFEEYLWYKILDCFINFKYMLQN